MKKILIAAGALICCLPWIDAAMALLAGIVIALAVGNPYADQTRKLTKIMLAISIVGLGAGMNFVDVAKAGLSGLGYTAISIALVMALGLFLGRLLKVERGASLLITVGTAICGGSAIAALAPVIQARPQTISVALAVVFVLNALALFIFPAIGHWLTLDQSQFGLWSALAIHDTSSVVGAASHYGPEALEVGTIVKLARALWIVPLVLAVGFLYREQGAEGAITGKPAFPWFILGFLAMAGLVTGLPVLQPASDIVYFLARQLLVVTLYFIGASLTRDTLKAVGVKPLIQGVILWLIVSTVSLLVIKSGLNV